MKKILSFLSALLLSTTMWAGGGIFEAWMTVQTNDGNPVTYKVNDGIALGTINQGKMDSVFIKVWKDNGTNITDVWACCKIDNGEPMEIPCQYGKSLGGNDHEWNAKLDFNFLQGLADGDHTIELWAKAKTNKYNCDEYIYMSNGGSNYKMTFTKESSTPDPVITYADSVYYVAGNFTNWAAEMKKLPAEAELTAEYALEFKQVLTRTVLADGVFDRNDTIWYGQTNEGSKMTRESSAWKLDGKFNVLATTDVAGTYTFSINENGEFVLGWPDSPATKLNNVKAQDGKRYNIFGQQVKETYRGIVIMNGQTYLQ